MWGCCAARPISAPPPVRGASGPWQLALVHSGARYSSRVVALCCMRGTALPALGNGPPRAPGRGKQGSVIPRLASSIYGVASPESSSAAVRTKCHLQWHGWKPVQRVTCGEICSEALAVRRQAGKARTGSDYDPIDRHSTTADVWQITHDQCPEF